MSKEETKDKGIDFHRVTRVLLILGLIGVSSAMLYSLLNPEKEPDVIFILLNEDKQMKDYPTQANVDAAIILCAYVENMLGDGAEFSLRVYTGANITLDEYIGVINNANASLQQTIDFNLKHNSEWISEPISSSFSQKGENYEIIMELWQKINGEWQYMPRYILILRIQVI
jgi:hypothetical protein